MSIQPTFSGEVQLAGWAESHNSGCKVTFWLSDPSDLDAFRAMTVKKGNQSGQRLACVLVEIGEDELPVQDSAPITKPEQEKPGPLCLLAVQWCRSLTFQEWLYSEHPCYWPDECELEPISEAGARELLCCVCAGIDSRKKLDTSETAAHIFHNKIRIPYQKFLQEGGA